MRKKWLVWVILIVILAGAGGGYYYYTTSKAKAAAVAKQPTLRTTAVRQGDLTISASATGNVIPYSQADLAFSSGTGGGTSGGVLMDVLVKVGDQVKQGDVLAHLQTNNTPDSISASITSAQHQVLVAQQALDNLQTNAPINRANALNNINTYAKAVRDAQYQLDNFSVPPEWSNLTPIEAFDQARQQLDKARAAFAPYKYLSENNDTRQQYLTDLADAQATFDTALKWLQYEYTLEFAEANLTKARQDYDLYENGPSPLDLAAATSDLETAKAQLVAAQATQSVIELVAPSDGTVMSINANVGQDVGSSAVITIANLQQPLLQVYADQADLDKVVVGNATNVTFDALPGLTFTGKVTQVSPGLATVSNVQAISVLVQLDPLPAGSPKVLPVGLDAAVDIISAQARNAVLVSRDALKELGPGEYAVFVEVNGELTLREVKVGLMDTTIAQIISGLNPGDVVSTGTLGAK
jgi:HlyD family secretion protein